MTSIPCEGCGRTLVATPAHAGLTVKCDACGALVQVPERTVPTPAVPGAASARGVDHPPAAPDAAHDVPAGHRDHRAAMSGMVPPPRASGADKESTVALTLSAVSLVIPIVGPFALWYAISASARLRERGEEEPATIRHARFMAVVGTVLLCICVVCCVPLSLLG